MLVKEEDKVLPKISYNVGALFDVPTSTIITGSKGESIIMGGLGPTMALAGPGNVFKSKIIHFFALSVMNRLFNQMHIDLSTYDTEVNVVIEQYLQMLESFDKLPDDIVYSDGRWEVSDKSKLVGNDWVKLFNDFINGKKKNKKVKFTALKNPYTHKVLEDYPLSLAVIDSLSDFEPESTQENADDIYKDDGSVQMRHMRKGAFTNNFISGLASKTVGTSTYVLMTAKIGEKKEIATGPAKYAKTPKKLQHLDSTVTLKGVSPEFVYLMFAAWLAESSRVLNNPSTKEAEYPLNSDDTFGTDLNIVKLKMLRSKRGPSGYYIEVIVSQIGGVQPTLTEFHYIKGNSRFGFEGNNVHYTMILKPDVKLSRTTVRRKINENPLLRRAINITAELHQLRLFQPHLVTQGLWCEPKELYEDIKKLGYDWDELLDTRGYMLPDQYDNNEKPFLSTVDLLKMRKGLYKPYWKKG